MRAGYACAFGALITAAAIDVAVIARTDGGESITGACRAHPVITGVVVGSFVAHLAGRPRCLAWADPYRAIGATARRVTR